MSDKAQDVYKRHIEERRRRAEELDPTRSPQVPAFAGAPAVVLASVEAKVDALEEELFALARDLYEHPEVGFEEVRTVEAIAELLARHGVAADVGAYGLPTAFHAVAGDGTRPAVAILAEYDALPGVGHGCGHNLIAGAAIGAFLALRGVIGDVGGTVHLIGTPAEESGGGKELILRAGGFDEVDAAIMMHPSAVDAGVTAGMVGRRDVEVTYRGRTAHAAANPYLGLNALDAAVAAYQGIAALRQHILPTDRIHGIVIDGGQAVNVVPDRAALRFLVRSAAPETLEVLSERADAVFRAAALATGTECDIRWDVTPTYLPMRANMALADRFVRGLASTRTLVPYYDTGESGGSSDMGNVSQHVPAIHPHLAFVRSEVPGHSAERAEQTVSRSGRRALRDGALGLAAVGADFLSDAELRSEVKREFEQQI